MRKQVYFDAERRAALGAHLAEAAATITAAGEIFREHFPALAWNTRALWVFAFEPEARDHYCKEILKREAEASRLPCRWDYEPAPFLPGYDMPGAPAKPAPEPLPEAVRLNRKFVEIHTREQREKIQALGSIPFLWDYLRAGVLSIGRKGETITARNAEALLDEFCTLYAEGREQIDFVEKVEGLRAAAVALSQAFGKLGEAAQGGRFVSLLEHCASDYDTTRLDLLAGSRLLYPFSRIRLLEKDATARALVTFFDLERAGGGAKFYNHAGGWTYEQKDAEEAAGFEMRGNLALWSTHRAAYPDPLPGANSPKFCRPLAAFK